MIRPPATTVTLSKSDLDDYDLSRRQQIKREKEAQAQCAYDTAAFGYHDRMYLFSLPILEQRVLTLNRKTRLSQEALQMLELNSLHQAILNDRCLPPKYTSLDSIRRPEGIIESDEYFAADITPLWSPEGSPEFDRLQSLEVTLENLTVDSHGSKDEFHYLDLLERQEHGNSEQRLASSPFGNYLVGLLPFFLLSSITNHEQFPMIGLRLLA